MGSPYTETLQDQHTERMTRARHVCITYRASWGPISWQGFPVFWFLLVITSALQSATRLYCLTIWRPSKWNPNPQFWGWPLLPWCGFCEPCAVTVPQFVFFILFTFENQPTNQPTNLNPILWTPHVQQDRCTPPPACHGHGSSWPHLPSRFLGMARLEGDATALQKPSPLTPELCPGPFAACVCLRLQEPRCTPPTDLRHTNQSLTAEPAYLSHFPTLVLLTNISPLSFNCLNLCL